MSTPTPLNSTPTSTLLPAPRGEAGRLPVWLREPLLHFVLIGGLLFALDAWLNQAQDDPRHIRIDAAVDAEAIKVFKDARGRAPGDEELFALRRVWLDNEVLYREGIALGMDQGDRAIRDRVIFKALSMVNAGLKLPAFDESTLRSWFEKNRSKYDEPPRLSFQEALLGGESGQAAARDFAAALNAGTPGDTRAGLRVFKDRPRDTVVKSFGAAFAEALDALPAGSWTALQGPTGWHVLRLEQRSAARPAEFEALRGVVLQDWKDSVMTEQRSNAVRALAQKYKVLVVADQ